MHILKKGPLAKQNYIAPPQLFAIWTSKSYILSRPHIYPLSHSCDFTLFVRPLKDVGNLFLFYTKFTETGDQYVIA
jgi:hypothetical protein